MDYTDALPRHVGIVMDGNGRWAQSRGKLRSYGHRIGTDKVKTAMSYFSHRGVQALTLYAFSTENWKRPKAEVGLLMDLISEYLDKETAEMNENNIVLRFIGDTSVLPKKALVAMEKSVNALKNNSGLTTNIALNYGGRAEITRAARILGERCQKGEITPEQITQEAISSLLYTADQPDVDLIIRTGGEKRLSNFLTWQSTYSEIYFSPVLWPDIDDDEFDRALEFYAGRKRRFGGL